MNRWTTSIQFGRTGKYYYFCFFAGGYSSIRVAAFLILIIMRSWHPDVTVQCVEAEEIRRSREGGKNGAKAGENMEPNG